MHHGQKGINMNVTDQLTMEQMGYEFILMKRQFVELITKKKQKYDATVGPTSKFILVEYINSKVT